MMGSVRQTHPKPGEGTNCSANLIDIVVVIDLKRAVSSKVVSLGMIVMVM